MPLRQARSANFNLVGNQGEHEQRASWKRRIRHKLQARHNGPEMKEGILNARSHDRGNTECVKDITRDAFEW
jgi:hypothetical protein